LKRVMNILSVFKEYVILAACIVVSLNLLALNDAHQIRDIRSVAIVVVGKLQEQLDLIPNIFTLRQENRILRERNVHLANEVNLLREAKLENVRLLRLLGLKDRPVFTYVSANVIGKNHQPMRTTITLDVGERDGVKPNMAVVSDAGLIGRVVATSDGYAVAQILLHKDSRVSVQIERERVDGILYWDGDEEVLRVKNTPRSANIKPGDVVVTSPYSSIFPPGIRVGIVSRVTLEPGALLHTIDVVPAADFSRMEEVFVITYVPDSSRVVLEQRMK